MINTTDKFQSLIPILESIQQEQNLTNLQMSQEIGCSSQLYRDTKNGNIPLGITVLKGAFQAFPQTALACLFFLSDGADITAQLAVISTSTPEKPCSQKMGGVGSWLDRFLDRIHWDK